MNGFRAIARLEFARLRRTPAALTLLLLVPLAQILIFGFAIKPLAGEVHIAVAAPAPAAGQPAIDMLKNRSGMALVTPVAGPPGSAEAAVKSGKADLGIEIPERPSLANPFARVTPAKLIVDGANANLTLPAELRLLSDYWERRAGEAEGDAAPPAPVVERLYNPQARADWTFLPALIGVVTMIAMVMLGCLSVAREREVGTWETLLTLPVTRAAMVLGKALPFSVIGVVQGAIVLVTAVAIFDLPALGSVVALLVTLFFYCAAHFMIGYAIAARAQSQLSALQGAIAFYLPAMLLSGFLYPIEAMPGWARSVGNLFPLSHFIRQARDILLRGASFVDAMAIAWPIMIVAVCAFILSIFLQRRSLS